MDMEKDKTRLGGLINFQFMTCYEIKRHFKAFLIGWFAFNDKDCNFNWYLFNGFTYIIIFYAILKPLLYMPAHQPSFIS